jgi:hypothetical protein
MFLNLDLIIYMIIIYLYYTNKKYLVLVNGVKNYKLYEREDLLMNKMLEKNKDGSIDVLDEYGYSIYRIDKYEIGIIASLASRLFEYETAMDKDNLVSVLNDYFSIYTDTYAYNLTRDKSAFSHGTMTMDDFEEFTEETTNDLSEYLINKI